ncbi:hypothetical protein PTNB73_04743 [Pyrenophora teres f. teres]|nr:hypothetical protein PTNB73_04743 [Pyrenophora teres f. teres]
MASTPSIRQFIACVRCVRQIPNANGTRRLLSTSAVAREEVQTQPANATPPSPPSNPKEGAAQNAAPEQVPEYMQKWGILDPQMVENKKQERRLLRREHVQPVGSRRRRAVLRRSAIQKAVEIPFEQLPYQCFQEARKVLLEDRQEKIKEIEIQQLRIKNLMAQDASLSGGEAAKNHRLRSMRKHLDELIVLADINDPVVKRKFEDGLGDMNKPIYRYLADRKWRQYKRLVLEQRITQLAIIPDLLPSLDLAADIDLGFGRKDVAPGDFVDSAISEKMPRLNVQTFTPGEKLVTVVVVDADVPVQQSDSFTYRCHFIASNIPISPTSTSIPLQRIAQEDQKTEDPSAKKIALPWVAPISHKGAPYHRLGIFVFEQNDAKPLDVTKFANTERFGFKLRSFADKNKLHAITATLFRTKWDDSMAGVMERAGMKDQIDVEFKRKRSVDEACALPHQFCLVLSSHLSAPAVAIEAYPAIIVVTVTFTFFHFLPARNFLDMPSKAPSERHYSSPPLPSDEQVALALAIIRTKPGNVQVRDYILQLRAQVKLGLDPRERDDPGRYIDHVTYWKHRCLHAEDECENLRNINTKLGRSNKTSASSYATAPDIDMIIHNGGERSPSVPSNRSPTRKKQTQKRVQRPTTAAQDTIEDDMDFLELLGSDGSRLTEALYTAYSLCRSNETDERVLCSNLVRIASGVGKVLHFVAHNHEHLSRHERRNPGAKSLDQDKSDFAIALSVCARAFMSILVGMAKLTESNPSTHLSSLVVCELVDMFKSALLSIATSAWQTAQDIPSQPSQPKRSKGDATTNPIKESVPARAVAHLLISFLGLLERSDPIHQKIFDGFVFVLFERVGKHLYYCTFGQHRSASIEANILPPPEPKDDIETAKRNAETLAIRLEAKALVLILERAMGLAPNHMNPQNTRTSHTNRPARTLSLKSPATASRARLSSLAKDRLQRTLVACMYGNKADDEFLDVLTKPIPTMRLASMQNVAKVENKDVEAWYSEEVWRLVGWDILAREDGW